MAKFAGYMVIAAFVAAFGWLLPFKVVVLASVVAFALIWATGAIVYEEWWPFRHW